MKSQFIQSLYFIKDLEMFPDHSFTFGLQPSALSEKDYALMKCRDTHGQLIRYIADLSC